MTDHTPTPDLQQDIHWVRFPTHTDERGSLTAIEQSKDLPFAIARIFYMHHITANRGGHAHRDTKQIIVAMHGSFRASFRTPQQKIEFAFHTPIQGLYVPPMVFIEFTDFSPDAVCLVLANTEYDMTKSLRSWPDYLAACQ